MKTKPLKIESIENIDISDHYCENELIEYFNNIIIKHGRALKKEGEIKIYKEDFITFPDKEIIAKVIKIYYKNGFAIYFSIRGTNEQLLIISTKKEDLYDEFYKMDFKTMTGSFYKTLNIHKTPGDWGMEREWLERIASNGFNHEGRSYKVVNLSKTNFEIIKIEDKKQKGKKSIFHFFKS